MREKVAQRGLIIALVLTAIGVFSGTVPLMVFPIPAYLVVMYIVFRLEKMA